MASLAYDAEFQEAIKAYPSIQMVALDTVVDTRKAINDFTWAAAKNIPPQEGVVETQHQVETADGTTLELLQFTPAGEATDGAAGPCIAFIHGGGLIALSTDIFRPLYQLTAAMTGRTVFGIPYRLAPEFPYPTPLDDVCASVRWISTHARTLGIDPSRIALYGQSAGGCLASGACLKLRDEGFQPPIAKLVLQQPMLDDRISLPPEHPKNKLLVWTQQLDDMGWEAYLGSAKHDRAAGSAVSEYAAPARATNLTGLPRVFIDIGSLDLYSAEAVAFASKLIANDVTVEMHLYAGVPHAFDAMAPGIAMSRDVAEKRIRALQDF
jgi:acetyl esterase/lipase